MDSWASPRPWQGVQEVIAILIILRCYLPFSLCDICSGGAEAVVGKTAGALDHRKAVAAGLLGPTHLG